MRSSLDHLPVELYLAIISHFDSDDCHQSLLSLSRAIPRSPVPTHILFERIHLRRPEQIFRLYTRLRRTPNDAFLVRSFSLETWKVDADVFVNLMALLPTMERLTVYVGPNFEPEHLEEIFQRAREGLQFISMRFRPYVQRPTYYPFLKGAYFDSTLLALSRWPPQTLPTLSVVQDPLDPSLVPTNFAQPLVFLGLDALATLAVSPLCYDLKHFRFRVPGRQVCRHLYTRPNSFPNLEHLDLSTSNASPRDLEGLLGRLSGIRVLVLDGCPIVSQRTDVQIDAGEPFLQWMELGQTLALAGVRRAAEREKKLKSWLEEYYANAPDEATTQAGASARKPRKGRKGLATAAFSLRAPSPERKASEEVTIPHNRIPPRGQKIRVLPSPPALCSLATSFPGELTPIAYETVKTEFERGWASGIARLTSIRLRLQTSHRNGVVRVVRFADKGMPEWEEEEKHGEQGLAGLVDVREESAFVLNVVADGEARTSARQGHTCPLLCLAGPGRGSEHIEGCGHCMGWDIFKDEM